MEDKIDLIIFQNWLIVGIIGLMLFLTILCNLKNLKNFANNPDDEENINLADLWERNQIDDLLAESEKILKQYPNREDALYWGGKALMKNKKFTQAKDLFSKLIEVDQTYKKTCLEYIQIIDEETGEDNQ